jgi:AcrR family transcriptional regulator
LDRVERRRQILEEARRLFSKRHYGAVSIEDVAAAAGVTRGLIGHYFGTKRNLYVEVVRETLSVPPLPVPEYVQGMSIEQRVSGSLDAWLEIVSANRGIWLAMISAEGLGAEKELQGILDDVRERAVDRIIEVLGVGPAADAPRELRAVLRSYGGFAEAASRQWLEKQRLSRAQIHVLLTKALLLSLDELLPAVDGAGAAAFEQTA